jgi:hypothetical protein
MSVTVRRRFSSPHISAMQCDPTSGAIGLILDDYVDLGCRANEHGYFVAMIIHVENPLLAHYRESNQSDIADWVRHPRLLRLLQDPSWLGMSCRSGDGLDQPSFTKF